MQLSLNMLKSSKWFEYTENTAKYLGIILDDNLSWHAHVQYINIKLSRAIGILSKLRHTLPKQMLRTFFFSFFQPHRENCINIWTCAPKTIEINMRKTIRIICLQKEMPILNRSLN